MSTISNDELAIKITIDDRNASDKLKKTGDQLKNTGKTAEDAGGGFSKLEKSIIVANQALGLLDVASRIFIGSMSSVVELIDRGERVGSLADGFAKLGGTAESIERASNASQGLISNAELLAIANKGIVAGLPDVNTNLELIAGAGAKLANTLGLDATQATEQLTQALATGRKQQLELLGVQFDTNQALEDYAASLGKSTDQLSEQEKRQATQEGALKRLAELNTELTDVTNSGSNARERFQNQLEGTIDTIAIAANSNEDLAEAIDLATEALKNVDVTLIIEGISSIIKTAAKAIETLVFLAEAAGFFSGKEIINEASFNRAANIIEKNLGGAANKLVDDFYDVSRQTSVTANDIERLEKQLSALARAAGSEIQTNDNLKIAFGELNTVLTDAKNKYADQEKASKLLEIANKSQNISVDKLTGSYSNQNGLTEGVDELTKSKGDLTEETKEVNEALKEEAQLAKEVSDYFENIEKHLENIDGDKQQKEIQKTITLLSDLQNVLGSAGGELLSGLLNGADSADFKDISANLGGNIGASIAASIHPALAPIGDVIGEELFGRVFDGFSAVAKGNREEIRRELDNILVPLFGAVTGGIISPLIGSLIGNKDAEANARRALTNFFNDAIKEAKKEAGISLADFYVPRGRDGFDAFVNEAGQITTAVTEEFNKLDSNVQQIFNNLAPALKEVFALDELSLDQIAQTFAINFGGLTNNLNDLQLLFNSMGLTAEQTGQMLEDAFFKGDLSANQFLSSSQQLEDVFTQGIPGAIGATNIAFDNLGNALESGQIGFDALGDLAVEAGEKGITSFDALRADLIASGKSIKDVDILFQGLAENGITSIEELQNITVRQTAGVINSLEQSGFAFNAMTDSVNELRAELDQIKSKEIDIKLNVKTNIDSNTQDLLRNPATAQAVPQLGNA